MAVFHAGNCRQYVGQPVMVRTTNGTAQGIVDRVASDGMYLRPMAGAVSGELLKDFTRAEQTDQTMDAQLVYYPYGGYGYGYNPASFFVPFLSILALSSLLFW